MSGSSPHLQDVRYKVVFVGDINVGKSCFLMRAIGAPFPTEAVPTISGDSESRIIRQADYNASVKLTFWDTAGQEKFKTTSSGYHRGANAFLLCYDITDRESFQNIAGWNGEIDRYCGDDVVKILIGNKCDLSNKRVVTYAEGKRLAETWKCDFFEASAKSGDNIEDAVSTLTELLLKKNLKKKKVETIKAEKSPRIKEKKKFSLLNMFKRSKSTYL